MNYSLPRSRGVLCNLSSETWIVLSDLVRDVMLLRAEDAEGGLIVLQREVIALFLTAFDSKEVTENGVLKAFILRSMRHHVLNAQQADVQLWKDELLMRAMTHDSNVRPYPSRLLNPALGGPI